MATAEAQLGNNGLRWHAMKPGEQAALQNLEAAL